MRVAIGGIWHETNTFAPVPTTLADFEVKEGAALLDSFRGTKTPLGGFLASPRFELVPALFASTTPSGIVQRAAYEELCGRFLARLADARPEGMLLDLHGAMVVEGIDEVEADLLGRIRSRFGPLPVGAVLDFHANVSDAFVERVDVFAGYDTYPHVDPYDRAVEVAGLLGRKTARAIARPPLLTVPQSQRTDASPMREVMALAHEAERDVLTVTVAGGFAYADVPHAGVSVTVTTEGDPAKARSVADRIARAAWEAREKFRVTNLSPAEAVAKALREPGPVILVDQADNIGGGSPGDGTVLLEELLKARVEGAVVTITDPEAVALAHRTGVGGAMESEIGGKTDRLHGPPVHVRATVLRLGSGDFTYKGSYMTNRRVTAGRCAVLESNGVRILVREKKVMPFDRQEIEVLGIDAAACRMIVVKSALAWRAAYGEIAKSVIEVDTPGACTARLETLPYRRLRRPIVPLDPVETW